MALDFLIALEDTQQHVCKYPKEQLQIVKLRLGIWIDLQCKLVGHRSGT